MGKTEEIRVRLSPSNGPIMIHGSRKKATCLHRFFSDFNNFFAYLFRGGWFCLDMVQHSLQGNAGIAPGLGIYSDTVDYQSGSQIIQRPEQMRQIDAVHSRADTLQPPQGPYQFATCISLNKTVYEVDFCSYGPMRPLRSLLDDLYDIHKHQKVEQIVHRLSQGNNQVADKTIYSLTEGFI